MPYTKLEDANPALLGIEPPIDLEQANAIAAMADAIAAGDKPPAAGAEWPIAIAQFKKAYTVKAGKWAKNEAPAEAVVDVDAEDGEDDDEEDVTQERNYSKPRKHEHSLAKSSCWLARLANC